MHGSFRLWFDGGQHRLCFCKVFAQPVRSGNLRLQNQRIDAFCGFKRCAKTLFTQLGFAEASKRCHTNGHGGVCGEDDEKQTSEEAFDVYRYT